MIDFIILDMEEDRDIPIILRQPFLVAARTLIDVQKGKLTLCVEEEDVTFDVFNWAALGPEDHFFQVTSLEGEVASCNGKWKGVREVMANPCEVSIVDSNTLELNISSRPKPSLEQPSKQELKPLTSCLSMLF